jgi:hypothetical protein
MNLRLVQITLFTSLLIGAQSFAAGGGSRSEKKIGVTLGILSDPTPSLWSIEGHFNLTNFLQIHGGYGAFNYGSGSSEAKTTAYGVGAKVFLPDWNFSPFAGFSYGRWNVDGNVVFFGKSIPVDEALNVMTLNAGIDWQTGWGLNLGGGISYVLAPSEIADSLSIIPQFYLGFYF